MKRFLTLAVLAALAAALTGCHGRMTLRAPDQAAAVGTEQPVVVRLMRSELGDLLRPVEGGAVRFQIQDGPLRATYSDRLGYAGTLVPVPEEPGVYPLDVRHLSRRGNEVQAQATLYAWSPEGRVTAVDLDDLPLTTPNARFGAEAVGAAAGAGEVIYFTRHEVARHAALRSALAAAGYPAGPVLLWRDRQWHLVRADWGLPRIVIEQEMVSQLPQLRERFANLQTGVTASAASVRAMRESGLDVLLVGPATVDDPVRRYADWQSLAAALRGAAIE